jgi:hypothetical protein
LIFRVRVRNLRPAILKQLCLSASVCFVGWKTTENWKPRHWPSINNRLRKWFNGWIFFLVNTDLCEQNILVTCNLSLQNKNHVSGEVIPLSSKLTTPISSPRKDWKPPCHLLWFPHIRGHTQMPLNGWGQWLGTMTRDFTKNIFSLCFMIKNINSTSMYANTLILYRIN